MKSIPFVASELARLLDERPSLHVTLTQPTPAVGKQVLQGPVRLERLLGTAERRLAVRGLDPEETARLLAPLRALIDEPRFWSAQDRGLLLVARSGFARAYRLPFEIEESVTVSDRFALRHLLPLLERTESFYVVALSINRVRVVRSTPRGPRRVDVPGLPTSLEDALGYDQYYSAINRHAGGPARLGRKTGMVHGHGDNDEERHETNLRAYFRQVAAALDAALPAADPWVLAAVREHHASFRQAVGTDRRLLDEGLAGNPDRISDRELCERARRLVDAARSARLKLELDRLAKVAGTPLVTDELLTLLTAAHHGRVDSLFVTPQARCWGVFDPDDGRFEVHDKRRRGDRELIDVALFETLRNGGAAFEVDPDRLPVGREVAAILRY